MRRGVALPWWCRKRKKDLFLVSLFRQNHPSVAIQKSTSTLGEEEAEEEGPFPRISALRIIHFLTGEFH